MRPFEQIPFDRIPDLPPRPHPFLDLERRTVRVRSDPFGEVDVAYREHGEGPPLVLIHGLMTSGYSFRYLIEPLAPRFRLIVPDLVGCGDSDKPDLPYTAEALGVFIGELMGALEVKGAGVVGNSLGGYLCMQLALSDPVAMRALMNIHSPGVPMARLHALGIALAIPGARAIVHRLIRRDPERWAHKNVHYWDESVKSREEARVYGAPLRDEQGRNAFIHYLADSLEVGAMRRFARRLEQAPFPVPMLLVYAERDPMVPPSVGEKLHALAVGTELVWLDSCSHFAHVDRPDAVADAIVAFFS
jgi:pimeloyl-ACP methyl ester carboxylesterase